MRMIEYAERPVASYGDLWNGEGFGWFENSR